MSDLFAMYGRLSNTMRGETPPAAQVACSHPKRLERVDEWIDPDKHGDDRFELHTVRTVCVGCDTTTGYSRNRRPATR